MRNSSTKDQPQDDDQHGRKSLGRLQTISSYNENGYMNPSMVESAQPSQQVAGQQTTPLIYGESEIKPNEQIESDQNPNNQDTKFFLGMKLKPGITKINVSYIFIMNFTVFMTLIAKMGIDQMILEDKNFYDLSSQDTIGVQSLASSISSIPSMFVLIFIGFIMDLYGRKWILFPMALITGVSIILMPIVSPSKAAFIGIQVVEVMSALPLGSNPLINDYVDHDSIGRASAITKSFLLLGVIIGQAGLFSLLVRINLFYSYLIMGLIFATIAIQTALMVQDPPDLKLKTLRKKKKEQMTEIENTNEQTEKQPTVCKLIKLTFAALRNDYELVIAYVMLFFLMGQQVMNMMYLRNWIYHFYEAEDGPLDSVDEVNNLYLYQSIVGTILSAIMMVGVAKIIDKMSPKFMITLGFLLRGLFNYSFFYNQNPKGTFFYIASPLYQFSIWFLAVNAMTYLQKKYPKNVRGILANLEAVVSALGTLAMTIIMNIIFQHWGYRAPFLAASLFDAAMGVFCLILALGGCITNKKPKDEENEEDKLMDQNKNLIDQEPLFDKKNIIE